MSALAQRAVQTGRDDGLIFDIGMDQCQDTDFYLKKGFRVVAVDANPDVCRVAERRYAHEINQGRLTVVNSVISDTRSPLTFYVCETLSAWSTASPKLRDWGLARGATFREVVVPGVTPADLLEAYGVPYFAKVDIEGFDLLFLRGLRPAPETPAFVSTELEFRGREYAQQIDTLVRLGYRRFAVVSQHQAPRHAPPRPALEGRDIDHTFAHHASGLFGKELREPWISADEARSLCGLIWTHTKASGLLKKLGAAELGYRLFPKSADWFDLHAAL